LSNSRLGLFEAKDYIDFNTKTTINIDESYTQEFSELFYTLDTALTDTDTDTDFAVERQFYITRNTVTGTVASASNGASVVLPPLYIDPIKERWAGLIINGLIVTPEDILFTQMASNEIWVDVL
jgi:hypothetical protein